MRLGLVSDIHGNHRALRYALEQMGPIDWLLCMGDVINQSRFCNDTVRILRDQDALTIWGNHEATFYGLQGDRARAAPWIEPDLLDWLGAQPRRVETELAGRRILLTHATSWEDGYPYVAPQNRDFHRFGEADADIILYGHTHQPVARRVADRLVVNPGSLGEGRPVEGGFALGFAVLNLTDEQVDFHEIRHQDLRTLYGLD